MLTTLYVSAAVIGAVIVIACFRARERRRTAESRHAALAGIAGAAPAGSRFATVERDARAWLEIGPTNEVSNNRGER